MDLRWKIVVKFYSRKFKKKIIKDANMIVVYKRIKEVFPGLFIILTRICNSNKTVFSIVLNLIQLNAFAEKQEK